MTYRRIIHQNRNRILKCSFPPKICWSGEANHKPGFGNYNNNTKLWGESLLSNKVLKHYRKHQLRCNKANNTNINDNIESEPERKEIKYESPTGLSETLHFTWFALQSASSPPPLYLPWSPVKLFAHSLAHTKTHSRHQHILASNCCIECLYTLCLEKTVPLYFWL